MNSFKLEIVSLDGPKFSGEVERLLVRTTDGDVEFLAGHTDLFATLEVGRVKITANGEAKFASASGGFLTVKDGDVTLSAITFEFASEIDKARAERAKERAEEALRLAEDERKLTLAKAKLARAINRINVSKMR